MILCPQCGSMDVIKYGRIRMPRREQRYRCNTCGRQFIMETVRPDPLKIAIFSAASRKQAAQLIKMIQDTPLKYLQ